MVCTDPKAVGSYPKELLAWAGPLAAAVMLVSWIFSGFLAVVSEDLVVVSVDWVMVSEDLLVVS